MPSKKKVIIPERKAIEDAIILSLSASELKANEPIEIQNTTPIASYSWTGARTPTILIPGSPRVWNNLNPKRVAPDYGKEFVDQNAARMGPQMSPLLPLFAAVDAMHKTPYPYEKLDLVSDRNNLRKLLRWICSGKQAKSFRIDIERVGQTVLFTRRQPDVVEMHRGLSGYGHNYERASTSDPPGMWNTTGYHRIIHQELGGIRMVLRFEVDACIPITEEARRKLGQSSSPQIGRATGGITTIYSSTTELTPQSDLIELKTKAAHKNIDWPDVFPQLYLSKTPHLYFAKHQNGDFQAPEKFHLDDLTNSFAVMKKDLAILTELSTVITKVRQCDTTATFALVTVGEELLLYKRNANDGAPQIPLDLRSRFDSDRTSIEESMGRMSLNTSHEVAISNPLTQK